MNFDFPLLRNWFYLGLFVFGIIWLSLYYNLDEIYELPPYSVHLWRQTDGTSLALNYYQDGLSFFKPRMHNVFTENGQSVGEFPLLYFIAGNIYHFLGVKEGYFRILSLLIFLTGIYCYSLILRSYSGNILFSLLGGLFLFQSPLNAFYGFNFLPDAPALGLVFIAWYLFHKHAQTGIKKYFSAGIFIFALAGLLKVTMLTSYIALLCVFFLVKLKVVKPKATTAFKSWYSLLLGTAFIAVTVAGWYIWAKNYNQLHSTYLLMDIKPVWDLDKDTIFQIYDRIVQKWYLSYFHISGLCFIGGTALLVSIIYRAVAADLLAFLFFITAGVIANIILWFGQLYHHDYYVITWMILPAAILLSTASWISNYPKKWVIRGFIFIMLIVAIKNTQHCKAILAYRYDPASVYNISVNHAYFKTRDLQSFVKKSGIKKTDKVISLPDTSPNTSLYLMNLTGQTNYNYDTPYTSERIDTLKSNGFKYLIIGDSTLLNDENLKPWLSKPIGVFDHSIYFYKL